MQRANRASLTPILHGPFSWETCKNLDSVLNTKSNHPRRGRHLPRVPPRPEQITFRDTNGLGHEQVSQSLHWLLNKLQTLKSEIRPLDEIRRGIKEAGHELVNALGDFEDTLLPTKSFYAADLAEHWELMRSSRDGIGGLVCAIWELFVDMTSVDYANAVEKGSREERLVHLQRAVVTQEKDWVGEYLYPSVWWHALRERVRCGEEAVREGMLAWVKQMRFDLSGEGAETFWKLLASAGVELGS